MTSIEFEAFVLSMFYPYVILVLINYGWFLPRAYRDLKNQRPTEATRKALWAFGLGALLTVLFGLSMITPWRGAFGLIWFFANAFAFILTLHVWQRHQILNNPRNPLHKLLSSMVMKGKD